MKHRCDVCSGRGVIPNGPTKVIECPSCALRRQSKLSAPIGEIARIKNRSSAGPPTVLRFVVPGEPVGKERPRVFRNKTRDGRVVTRAVTPEKTAAYEEKVRTCAQLAANQQRWTYSKDDRFSLLVRAYTTHYDAHPDLDNIGKAIMDALNKDVGYRDDRYVRGIGWAFPDPDPDNPRVEVEVQRFRKRAA